MGKFWPLIMSRLLLSVVLIALSAQVGAQGYQWRPWLAGQAQPALEVRDTTGRLWRVEDQAGRVVLVNFWASWCEPCVTEMPSLQALATQRPDELTVLAVNFKQSLPAIDAFVQRTGLTLPVVADLHGALARQWGVKVFPSTVMIDAQGKVHGVVQGELDWVSPQARALLRPLLPRSH